jgi:hypothetical protein
MSKKVNESINDALNLPFNYEPLVKKEEAIKTEIVKAEEPDEVIVEHTLVDVDTDYDKSRDVLDQLITQGMETLEELKIFAEDGESARAFEVYFNSIRQLADMNEKRLKIHKDKKEVDEESKKSGTTNVTNNTLITTTSDLLDQLRDHNLIDDTRRKQLENKNE